MKMEEAYPRIKMELACPHAETDMNLVMAEGGGLIEIQGTAEQKPFTREELDRMLDLGTAAIAKINELQRQVLGA